MNNIKMILFLLFIATILLGAGWNGTRWSKTGWDKQPWHTGQYDTAAAPIVGDWILETGVWNDVGVWKDTSTWNDS